MEIGENVLTTAEKNDGEPVKKGKILTLLLPLESQSSDGKESKKDKNKPPTKVVVRRLPPKLTKDGFAEEFSPLPDHDYLHFVRADLSLGSNGYSRAYINFVNQEDIFPFKEKYDDHLLKDEKGKEYHAVVEFAPFQKVPRKNVQKKKVSKAGTLEADPKYIEFLQKLEDLKNATSNASEYFHETDNLTTKQKITTTPLLEFLKQKRQKRIDLRNEMRQKKREAEKERRRKEDEKRKTERERRSKEDKGEKKNRSEEKKGDEKTGRKGDEKGREKRSEEKSKRKGDKKDAESDVGVDDTSVLKVVVGGQSEKESNARAAKTAESETNLSRSEKKYSDFRTRLAEEKQRKTFHKKDNEAQSRRGFPDEKGDNHSIGSGVDAKRAQDGRGELKTNTEAKSKYRYSEQRNREREFRNQKSDSKKEQAKAKAAREEAEAGKGGEEVGDPEANPARRKSLDMNRGSVDCERKRSKSFHDEASEDPLVRDRDREDKAAQLREDNPCEATDDSANGEDSKKDPRIERRIRNKDRPSIEIYRPGMGKFSKQRLEQKREEPNSTSPSGAKSNVKSSNKSTKKTQSSDKQAKAEEGKAGSSEVRTMTFTRSSSKEN